MCMAMHGYQINDTIPVHWRKIIIHHLGYLMTESFFKRPNFSDLDLLKRRG